jgi:hypothetical protein
LMVALALGHAAWAQTPASAPLGSGSPAISAPPSSDAVEPRIERMDWQDRAARIEEMRVGGQVQRLTVTPKSDMPAYEVVPANGARNRPQGERDAAAGNTGQRVWNVMRF